MRFRGLEPWPSDYHQVEVVAGESVIDLHNFSKLCRVTLTPNNGAVDVALELQLLPGHPRSQRGATRAVLTFEKARAVSVSETGSRDADLFDHFDFFERDDGLGEITVETGTCLLSMLVEGVTLQLVTS